MNIPDPMMQVILHTFGHPVLYGAGGIIVTGLRRKDMALLVYLCVEGAATHARSRLAGLLWGENPEERARHSLTQALGRLARVLEPGVLSMDRENVRWAGGLACDARALLSAAADGSGDAELATRESGRFLEGFDPGVGAEDFQHWADRRRADLRNAALRVLEEAGAQAEAAGEWERALRLGERAIAIDRVWERGHRRILRALAAGGERNRGLRHYQQFEAWLAAEYGGQPDPDTRALAADLRARPPAPTPTQTPRPTPTLPSNPPGASPAVPAAASTGISDDPVAAAVDEAAAAEAASLSPSHPAPGTADEDQPDAALAAVAGGCATGPRMTGSEMGIIGSGADDSRSIVPAADRHPRGIHTPAVSPRRPRGRWVRLGVFILLKLLMIGALVTALVHRATSRAEERREGEQPDKLLRAFPRAGRAGVFPLQTADPPLHMRPARYPGGTLG